MSTALALKFLMAKKFDVDRASKLFKRHLEIRAKYNMAEMKPLDEPLSRELLSEKLTILVSYVVIGPLASLSCPVKTFIAQQRVNESIE